MGLLHRGDVVEGRYTVLRKLGEGQFAEVWEVKLSADGANGAADTRFALKLEKSRERNILRSEYKVLKKLGGLCSQVVGVEGSGSHNAHHYIVMELLGDTLFDARKQAGGAFDCAAASRVGLSTLHAIQELHQQGYIHRDIKPANLVLQAPGEGGPAAAAAADARWSLIDFGLARRFTEPEGGGHLPARPDAAFRGSTTYASLHAHREEDLSRRDDLWSWFYVLVECVDGCLPWRAERAGGDGGGDAPPPGVDKAWVAAQKEACMQEPQQLTRNVTLPEPLVSINSHLRGLSFTDAPDYGLLAQCVQQLRGLTPTPKQQQQQQQPAAFGSAHMNGLLRQQQQQRQQEVADLLTPASPPDGQQQQQQQQQQLSLHQAAAAAAAAGSKRSWQAGAEHQQQQGVKRARQDGSNHISHSTHSSPADVDSSRAQQQQQQQQAHSQEGGGGSKQAASAGGRPRSREQQQQGASKLGGGAATRTPAAAGAGPGRGAAGAGGRCGEIADLLSAFQSAPPERRAAAQQVVDALCGLSPLDAVSAIGVTLDRLVHQSRPSCLADVSQLLLDLAAFAASGAAAANKAAAAQQQQQRQQQQQQQQQAQGQPQGQRQRQQPAAAGSNGPLAGGAAAGRPHSSS